MACESMSDNSTAFNLETFDTHLQSLQSTLQFFTSALAASHQDQGDEAGVTESDLIGLKGRTGMLVDDMLRVRKRVRGGGETAQDKKKARLSIEGSKDVSSNSNINSHLSSNLSPGNSNFSSHLPPTTRPPPPPSSNPTIEQNANAYQPHYLDVTEEVNRRLQEARLRALRDHPSTAQKRKRESEEEEAWRDKDASSSSLEAGLFSPVKKVKSAGEFNMMGGGVVGVGVKRSGDRDDDGGANGMGTGTGTGTGTGNGNGYENGNGYGGKEERGHVKRRRKM